MISTDKKAERPEVGYGGLKWVQTTQVVMRKDLRFPPADSVASVVVLLAVGYYVFGMHASDFDQAWMLLGSGQIPELMELLQRVL